MVSSFGNFTDEQITFKLNWNCRAFISDKLYYTECFNTPKYSA